MTHGQVPEARSKPPKPQNPVDQEDAFVAKAFEVTTWAQRNQRLATIGVGAVVLAVAAFLYYGNYKSTLNEQAAAQLEQLQRRLDAGDLEGRSRIWRSSCSDSGTRHSPARPGSLWARSPLSSANRRRLSTSSSPWPGTWTSHLEPRLPRFSRRIYEDAGNLDAAEGLYLRLADRAELGFQVRDALADAAGSAPKRETSRAPWSSTRDSWTTWKRTIRPGAWSRCGLRS